MADSARGVALIVLCLVVGHSLAVDGRITVI
jgi:hypothetical protein